MADAPVEVLLIRHGRTAWNASRRFLGRTDLPLDAIGREQAAALAAHPELRALDAVYASPLSRAWETALALSPVPRPDAALVEMHQGELEGMEGPDAIARHPSFFQAWVDDPTGVVPPGGEPLDAARDRGLDALARIVAAHPGPARVAVVTHQMVLASVCAHLAGEPLKAWRRFAVGNTGWRRLRWEADRVVVLEGWDGVR